MKRKSILGVFALAAFVACSFYVGHVSAQKRFDGVKKIKSDAQPKTITAPQSTFVENFDSTAGTLLTNAGWTAHSAGGTNPITVTAPGLTFTGWPSAGNAVSMTTSGEDANKPFPVQTSGSVYAGILVSITDAAVDASGGYFFHLGPDPIGTTFRGRLFIKKDASNNIAFGITKAGVTLPTDIAFTPFSFALNTTYLLVIKYTVVAGATNDTVDLIVNPTLGGAEPAPALTAPDVGASDINPASLALRQGTAATHPTVRVDGIRVATSWASLVTPAPAVRGDFNGDGRTDWAITRVSGGSRTWWIQNNNNSGGIVVQFGLQSDVVVPADYDGDGKADIAVWRRAPATQAAFYILQSSTVTVRTEIFGQIGDTPATVGDYDGDGKADVSVYRLGATVGAQSFFFYRGSLNNPTGAVTYIPWGINGGGVNGDLPYAGDYDGDGKFDACIARAAGAGGQVQFILRRSSDGVAEYVTWGLQTDAGIPGDYDGDGRYDFCVVRINGNTGNFYILERDGGGTGASPIVFGDASVDQLAPGDYDGDGKTDIVIWRPNVDPLMNFFWVRQSSNGAVVIFEWGQNGDEPVTDFVVVGGGP